MKQLALFCAMAFALLVACNYGQISVDQQNNFNINLPDWPDVEVNLWVNRLDTVWADSLERVLFYWDIENKTGLDSFDLHWFEFNQTNAAGLCVGYKGTVYSLFPEQAHGLARYVNDHTRNEKTSKRHRSGHKMLDTTCYRFNHYINESYRWYDLVVLADEMNGLDTTPKGLAQAHSMAAAGDMIAFANIHSDGKELRHVATCLGKTPDGDVLLLQKLSHSRVCVTTLRYTQGALRYGRMFIIPPIED